MHGFSLVELSIVLVILGLLTGGILSGQSLIRAAELRAVTSEYQIYSAAVHTFRSRYMAVPGDMPNATKFWGKDNAACPTHDGTAQAGGTCNGNGDGRATISSAANQNGESSQLWRQMALAGLVEGTYSGLSGSAGSMHAVIGENVPRSKLSNAGWTLRWLGMQTADTFMFVNDYGNVGYLGAQRTTNNSTHAPILKPEEAWNIDTKIDDGRPAYGRLISYPVGVNCVAADSGALAHTNLNASYNVSSSAIGCALMFPNMF